MRSKGLLACKSRAALFAFKLSGMERGLTREDTLSKISALRNCRGSSLVERRPEKAGVASSILAPGTTRLCKRLIPEEVHISHSLKLSRPILLDTAQGELSDLFCQQRSLRGLRWGWTRANWAKDSTKSV